MIKRLYNNYLSKVIRKEEDPLNQARIKMLVFGLTMNLFFALTSIILYAFYGPLAQLQRASGALLAGGILMFLIAKWPVWRQVSHVLMTILTMLVWSNVFIYVQGVNIPTLQFIFIIIVYSFYVHGLAWGVVYTLANVLPVLIYTAVGQHDYFVFEISRQKINLPIYMLVISYNFGLILYLHYHFFKSFISNIRQVNHRGDELKLLNSQLQVTMAELEKTSNARIDFLSTMSHELRTPLNGVIGLANVMLMQEQREEQKENLSLLKFSAENLLALVNDILDFNKLGSEKVLLEEIPFHLQTLVKNVGQGLRLRAEEKGIELHMSVDEQLERKQLIGDPTRLTQILVNLGSNAVKFTEKGSVRINVSVTDINSNIITLLFSVTDTGIGITEEQKHKIFQPFTQASESVNRKFGGTGLGLAIVKGILELHNSNIEINSEPGKGTTFFFKLNYLFEESKTEKTQATVEGGADENVRSIRILVAEDNPINVLVVKKLLSNWGLSPEFAENGEVAVSKLKENDYDLVLMDLHMPVMDGYTAATEIRSFSNPLKRSIPIIALTASVSEDVKVKVKDAGMDGYLPKPFKPQDLKDKLLEVSNRN